MAAPAAEGRFDEAIAGAAPQVQALARRLRERIRASCPQVVEVPWPKQQIVGFGLGPKKLSEHFCYLSVHARHVNLGFNHGTALPDPAGLLAGTGKAFRHIRLTDEATIDQPAVTALLQAAIAERRQALCKL